MRWWDKSTFLCKARGESVFELHIRAREELQGTAGANAAINVGRVTHEGSWQQENSLQQPPETISMEISSSSAYVKILNFNRASC